MKEALSDNMQESKNPTKAVSQQKSRGDVGQTFVDNREISASQSGLQFMIDSSPRITAQRKLLESAFGDSVQQKPKEEEEELLQGKFVTKASPAQRKQLGSAFGDSVQQKPKEEEEELLQGKFVTKANPAQRKEQLAQQKNQTGMPDQLKGGLEQLSGTDLSGVRVHYNSSKPAQLNALAYTQGANIHVAPGQDAHLPHEGWHAVQQMQGRVSPTTQSNGVAINDDKGLESEADVMGAKARKATF